MRLNTAALLLTAAPAAILLPPSHAEACGGLVQPELGTVGADVQRAFFSVRQDTTEVVLQLVVPKSANDYGVIVPVPDEPTLSPTPVEASDLDDLDAATAPRIFEASDDDGGGCGCLGAAKAGGDLRNVQVGTQLDIGPVSAVTLTATTGAAVRAWLSQNGFAISNDAGAIVDSYAGAGRWFVAFKRSTTAAKDDPSTVGVQMTVPGDRRDFAIRMASIGAGSEIGITVFVAAAKAVGPNAPWAALTLDDLDTDMLANDTYRAAVRHAVAGKNGRAFVVEGIYGRGDVSSERLRGLMDDTQILTRLTTVLEPDEMTLDVAFTAGAPEQVPSTLTLPGATTHAASYDGPGGAPAALLAPFLLLLAAFAARPRSARRVAA